MVDPKMVEFSMYNDIPHLLTPVITDPKNAIFALDVAVKEMERRALERAKIVYDEIDRNKLFVGTVEKEARSVMNLCFVMKEEYKELETEFMSFATSKGMVGIKGHRSVGGFRASCYNAMSIEGCRALVECMKEFEANH